ncbi:MAG: PD-(D/E)XK nuclease family protein [Phycisphaeraceae bacterium]|nr:PD-(D/E)XK nuclease family protein [Phycisphaeraceae bacterium]
MSVARVFLGWDEPCLPLACRWLWPQFAAENTCDLSDVIIVTPTARAGRRLLELLAEHAEENRCLWSPPTLTTPGQLPSLLLSTDKPLANAAMSLAGWAHALRHTPPDELAPLVPHPPEADDTLGWLRLADELETITRQLAAEMISPAQLAQRAAQITDSQDTARYDALTALHGRYLDFLIEQGLTDPDQARVQSLQEPAAAADRLIILLAIPELSLIARRLCAAGHGLLTALIHAPEEEQAAFDDFGCVRTEAWLDRHVPLDASHLRVVTSPSDQAQQVLSSLTPAPGSNGIDEPRASASGAPSHPPSPSANRQSPPPSSCLEISHPPDQITVGLADEELGPAVERTLSMVGLPVRRGPGRTLRESPPGLLLQALADFIASRRLDDFATLLRHPDAEAFLADHLGESHHALWLSLLDRYATETLQQRLTGRWLGDPQITSGLKAVHDAVEALIPPQALVAKPAPAWIEPAGKLLASFYEGRALRRQIPADQPVIRALEIIGSTFQQIATLAAYPSLCPTLTLPQLCAWVLSLAGHQPIPPEGGAAAVELVGWLEMPTDDAAAQIIVGFNEGCLPQDLGDDPLLPDRLRRELGLPHGRSRYARDLMMLTSMLHSRPGLTLIAGRRRSDDTPLKPSRLALACPPDQVAWRLAEFFEVSALPAEHAAPQVLAMPAHLPRATDLHAPLPQPVDPPLDRLPVTAFADYLSCPYRFYLKHVLKLATFPAELAELDGREFGSLAHLVLKSFAQSPLAPSADAQKISRYFNEELDRQAAARYGPDSAPAIRLQCEQLRARLEAFAQTQAQSAAEGWRIRAPYIERAVRADFPVDNLPFTLIGQIDRIDQHPEHGYRILDYKTSDTAHTPQALHRRAGQWINLQLPLYRVLAQSLGLSGPMQLGLISLPRKSRATAIVIADWNEGEIQEAVAVARQVIQAIRAARFWPPADQPDWNDGLSALCWDHCHERGPMIQRVSQSLLTQEGAP